MAVQLGADRTNAEMEVKKLLDFEIQLKEVWTRFSNSCLIDSLSDFLIN